MNVYVVEYDRTVMGSREDAQYVVIANTEKEALGLAMGAASSNTKAEDYFVTEIDKTEVGAHLIASYNF